MVFPAVVFMLVVTFLLLLFVCLFWGVLFINKKSSCFMCFGPSLLFIVFCFGRTFEQLVLSARLFFVLCFVVFGGLIS